MKKRTIACVVGIIVLLIGYYFISKNALRSKINVNEVEYMTINEKKYNKENDTAVITKIISFYNEAKIYKKDGDTTLGYIIVIKLKSGQKINISGTTQSFHYVNYGKKSYKISNQKLSQYLRNGMK